METIIKILEIIAVLIDEINYPFFAALLVLKGANSKKSFKYWVDLSALNNFYAELNLRRINKRKFGTGHITPRDWEMLSEFITRPKASFFRFYITYNPKHLFKNREHLERLKEFAETDLYEDVSMKEVEELMSKNQATAYAYLLFSVSEYRKDGNHLRKNHIFRGIFSE